MQKGNLYTFTSDQGGFDTNNYFYDNGEEVVVFDTQFTPDIAENSIAFLRTKTQNPITYVVVTHPNPDKFNAMSVFQALGAKVVASNKTVQALSGVQDYKKYYFVNVAKMFTEENYPKLGKPDVTFDKEYELVLQNGEKILLKELGQPGVSSNQTVASIPSIGAVIVGDLVHYKAHAWLEGGIVGGNPAPAISGWIADLEELKKMFSGPVKVYGGRGKEADLAVAADEQINYLKKADQIVDEYIAGLGEKKSELKGDQAQAHYANLQKKFEEAFPDYQLSYMTLYSIYGLVNSKL